ncbi:MAG: hypothetical protein ACREOI_08540 [bacterium]
MRKKVILSLGTAFCLSFASLASSQEAPEKAALLTTEQARVKLQNQVNAEKSRIINRVGQLPQNQRKKALANQVENSLILQQARNSEVDENQAPGLRKANSETAASMREIIVRLNNLPVAERKKALRETIKALKGKKQENTSN